MVAGAGNELPGRWKNLGAAIEEVVVWDAVYYVRIAECGYEYEQTHAFFPVFPLSIRFLAKYGKLILFFSHGSNIIVAVLLPCGCGSMVDIYACTSVIHFRTPQVHRRPQ